MHLSVLPRSHRQWMVAFACVAVPLLCSTVRAFTITTTGNPVPSATIALNASYTITVQGVPDSNNFLSRVDIGSASGDANGPTNSFANHGTYNSFSNTCNATAQHTFTVVNQATGYYWWQGGATEVVCGGGTSVSATMNGVLGYFYTPTPQR